MSETRLSQDFSRKRDSKLTYLAAWFGSFVRVPFPLRLAVGAPLLGDSRTAFMRRLGVFPAGRQSSRVFPYRLRRVRFPFISRRGERGSLHLASVEFERKKLVLPDRIELSTSPLPMECSTTELRQHARVARTGRIGPYRRPILATTPSRTQARGPARHVIE
jgi:hypothetical protein